MNLRIILCGFGLVVSLANGAKAEAGSARVGVYDSRAIAFAHFHRPGAVKQREAWLEQAKVAKAGNDTAKLEAAKRALSEAQKRSHLQVFSTAPADEAMAALAPQSAELQRQLGVQRFVSKWDGAALRDIPEADRVDVTDQLVRVFITPTEKQQKTIDAMKTTKPLPLWRAKLLLMFGGM